MDQPSILVPILLNLLPALIIFAVLLFVLWRGRGGTGYQKTYLEIALRQVEALEKIAASLEDKRSQ